MAEKETFYFSHDYNSREDEKIRELIFQCGMTGYGIYWAIIEMLYQNANALRTNYSRIAFDLHQSHAETIKAVIEDFGLFSFTDDKDFFYSKSIERRLEKREEKSKKARESALNRWNKKENANASKTQCETDAIKESKVKESKVNVLLEKEPKQEKLKKENPDSDLPKAPEGRQRKKVAPKKESPDEILEIPDGFRELWAGWHEYRKARKKKPYAGVKWEQMALDKLLKLSGRDPTTAELILQQTYENNYEGFFELKNYNNGKPTNHNANGGYTANNGNSTGSKNGKISARQFLAREFKEQFAGGSESGNITIDAEVVE